MAPAKDESAKTKLQTYFFIQIEKVVRFDLSKLLTDKEIATHLGCSIAHLQTIRRHPFYSTASTRIRTGIASKYDQILADTNYAEVKLREMLHESLDVMHDTLTQRVDPKLRFTAALEVLDREGRFAPVKRVGLPTEAQGGAGVVSEKDNAIAARLISAVHDVQKKEKVAESGD